MAQEVTLTMDGMILNWLKQIGEPVSAGDIIAEIEADKATVEVEAPADGVLLSTTGDPGEELEEGTVIALIGDADEQVETASEPEEDEPEAPDDDPDKVDTQETAQVEKERSNGVVAATTPDGRIKASPVARRIAEDKGIDLAQIKGSGPGGRIVKVDVENFDPASAPAPAEQPAAAPQDDKPEPSTTPAASVQPAVRGQTYGKLPQGDDVEIIDISRMRRAIADSTIASQQLVPHFYVTVEMDVSALLALRKELNTSLADEGVKISVNDMVVKAAALTLRKFPNLNSHYYGDKIVRYKPINIGIAVALPNNGLLNVVAKDADKTTLSVMAVQNREMFERARDGKIKPEDIRGATFTVSNLGPYDVDHFAAIISPPEAGILAVGSAKKVPIVNDDGTLGVGNRMKVTISVDHRVSDGAEGAEFMRTFREFIENPMRLLV